MLCAVIKKEILKKNVPMLILLVCLFVAYNSRNSTYIRNKYKKKMEEFVECCNLITYLGDKMTRKYKEPQRRPIDFDFKMRSFLLLKHVDPTCV